MFLEIEKAGFTLKTLKKEERDGGAV